MGFIVFIPFFPPSVYFQMRTQNMTADEVACTFEMKSAHVKSHAYSKTEVGQRHLLKRFQNVLALLNLSHVLWWARTQLREASYALQKDAFSQHVLSASDRAHSQKKSQCMMQETFKM